MLLYLLSANEIKAGKAEDIIASGGIINVQVLNEFASVATKKLKLSHEEIQEILAQIRLICAVEPVTVDVHDRGLHLARHYGFSISDAMIVAASLMAGCTTLYTEDMQNGQIIDNQVIIRNPFI